MAIGDPQYVGGYITPGFLIPQEGAAMRTTEWGYDTGERRYLTHPGTSTSSYPQRNQSDSVYSTMFVRDVVPRQQESGLIEITAAYKGLISSTTAQNKPRLLPGAQVQMFSIGVLSSGKSVTLIAPVPTLSVQYEFVTTTQPTYAGVGANASGAFLPLPAAFAITFVPDPDASNPPRNYLTGWVLEDRKWDDVASKVWLVTESYRYYYVVGGS